MNLNISIAQIDVTTAKPEENLKKAETLVAQAAEKGSSIICFPEMWTTGFNWAENKRLACDHEKVIGSIAGLAKRYNIWINGSVLLLDKKGDLSNASILFDPKGKKAAVYCKTHLFSLIQEDKNMKAGDSLCVVDTPWGLTGLSVCYDIRFPEVFRTYALKGVKIVFSPMAFPKERIKHWKILVRARAIENQMFMVGVNQVGTETREPEGLLTYGGDSVIIDPWGETVVEAGDKEELLHATIDMAKVDEVRKTMNVLDDRRPELYKL
jgi:predicted amidohydrolase